MDETVLVTGGAGYIGSHAVRRLLRAGYRVVILDDLSAGHRWAVPSDVPLIVADIADTSAVTAVIRDHAVSSVLHFAARSIVAESMSDPASYYHTNVCGTARLLDAMRSMGVARIVFSSSAAVYGEPSGVPVDEDAPLAPTNVYGRTKRIVEEMLRDHEEAYGLRWASLRYFNAAGAAPDGTVGEAHDPETHLIPLALAAAAGRRPSVTVFGDDYPTPDGTCIRDYVHVMDLADAHVQALTALGRRSRIICNLGTGTGFSVHQIIEAAERVVGHAIPITPAPRRPGDPAVLVAGNARANAELGWEPHWTDLETIIRTAWTWEQRRPM